MLIEHVLSSDQHELIEVLRIEMSNLLDLRDCNATTLEIVDSGRALLLEMPTFSKLWAEEYHVIHHLDATPCAHTLESHNICVNTSRANNCMTSRVLMMLPDDHRCTTDFSSACTMEDGHVKTKQIRQAVFDKGIEGPLRPFTRQQVQPLVWQVRLAHDERKVLVDKAVVDTEGLMEAFAGAKLR